MPVAQDLNVLRRRKCVMEENLCVKMRLMWSFVTSTTMIFVNLIIKSIATNVLRPVHQNTKNVIVTAQTICGNVLPNTNENKSEPETQ